MSMNLMSSSSWGSRASMPAISSCANSFMSASASISLAAAKSSVAWTYSRALAASGPWLAYSFARRLYSFWSARTAGSPMRPCRSS